MLKHNKKGHFVKGSKLTGKAHPNYKHGMDATRPYRAWSGMKRRCSNPNDAMYKHYGGRGIDVCDKWLKFEGFWEDMQDTYFDDGTIERIDNDGNYNKENCKWVPFAEQALNRRSTRRITYKGKEYALAELARKFGFKYHTLRDRLEKGWTVQRALTKPLKR